MSPAHARKGLAQKRQKRAGFFLSSQWRRTSDIVPDQSNLYEIRPCFASIQQGFQPSLSVNRMELAMNGSRNLAESGHESNDLSALAVFLSYTS
jgi:hypothetical protein